MHQERDCMLLSFQPCRFPELMVGCFIDSVPVGLAPVDRYSKITSYCHLFGCDLCWRWKDD